MSHTSLSNCSTHSLTPNACLRVVFAQAVAAQSAWNSTIHSLKKKKKQNKTAEQTQRQLEVCPKSCTAATESRRSAPSTTTQPVDSYQLCQTTCGEGSAALCRFRFVIHVLRRGDHVKADAYSRGRGRLLRHVGMQAINPDTKHSHTNRNRLLSVCQLLYFQSFMMQILFKYLPNENRETLVCDSCTRYTTTNNDNPR